MRTYASVSAALAATLSLTPVTGCAAGSALGARGTRPIPAATASAQGPATSFTVVATGDMLPHRPVIAQALRDGRGVPDFRAIMAGIKPIISSADLAICHLETPLGGGFPVPGAPPQLADALSDLGYRSCSTASEHTLDQGPDGVRRTLDALDRVHIRHSGSARTAREAATPNLLDVRGVRVAHLSYTFGFDRFPPPPGSPWLAGQIDASRILAAAHLARKAGAQVVIVSLHWGADHQRGPTPGQVALARELLASPDIDLIVGHHVHVVQPFARATGGKWVAYGVGDLVAADGRDRGEGLIARFTFTLADGRWSVSRAEFIPTYVDAGPPLRVIDVPAALRARGIAPARRAFLRGIVDRTSGVVYSRRALPTLAG